MPKYAVKLDVDGTEHQEEVGAPDCKLAMSKALKLHSIKVLSITPLEEQLDFGPEDTPGATTIDEMLEGDPAMHAIGEAIAAEDKGVDPVESSPPSFAPSLEEVEVDPEGNEAVDDDVSW